jgi:hypothetical protein
MYFFNDTILPVSVCRGCDEIFVVDLGLKLVYHAAELGWSACFFVASRFL